MSKRMENKEKSEKRERETEKGLNLDLAGTRSTAGLRGRYSGYDGFIVGGTRPTMVIK